MKPNKVNGAAAQINEVKNAAMQVENTNAQVADNKSALAGEREKVCKTLIGNLRKLYKSRTTINGRLLDLAECAGDYAAIVKSGDFKGAVKSNLDHLTLIQTDGKGNAVGTHHVPVRWVALASRESYTDYKIEDLVVKYMGRKSAKNWSLMSYTHSGEDTIVTEFAKLRHEFTHEVTRTQSAVAADGTQVTVPVYESDENGNRKVVKDAVTETFVPVVCDTVAPKVFEAAVEKAVAAMWLVLFAK